MYKMSESSRAFQSLPFVTSHPDSEGYNNNDDLNNRDLNNKDLNNSDLNKNDKENKDLNSPPKSSAIK